MLVKGEIEVMGEREPNTAMERTVDDRTIGPRDHPAMYTSDLSHSFMR